jgi:hypothetical protein
MIEKLADVFVKWIINGGGNPMSKNSGGVSSHTHTQSQLDHYANQHNPNNSAYQANLDNHANQLNPNNTSTEGVAEGSASNCK